MEQGTKEQLVAPSDVDLFSFRRQSGDVADTVIEKIEADSLLADIKEQHRDILVLYINGYNNIQIAEIIGGGKTPQAIQQILYRIRLKLKQFGHAEGRVSA